MTCGQSRTTIDATRSRRIASRGAVDWRAIRRLLATANAELRLDVSVDYTRLESLETLRVALRDADLTPATVTIFPSEAPCLDAARRAFPQSLIGGGTPHFFVQLNRIERLGRPDFLTFTTSPIVHGADDESVMLTLQSLPSMIDTLRALDPDARVAVGRSMIGVRRSPLGNQPETDGTRRVALARQDPRCRGLFGAAWVLGYVAQFARAGVDALTLMSLTGASGLLVDTPSGAFMRTPAYWVLERLSAIAQICLLTVSEPARVAALALRRANGESELLVANLTGDAIDVEIEGGGAAASCAILDAAAWETLGSTEREFWSAARRSAAGVRIRLDAYAVASRS